MSDSDLARLDLSGRQLKIIVGIRRLIEELNCATVRLTQVQILRASGTRGKDVGDVFADLERLRILRYESGPDGTRFWLAPAQEWRVGEILSARQWNDLVDEVKAVNAAICAQLKADLVTELPSLARVMADVVHAGKGALADVGRSAEEQHTSRAPDVSAPSSKTPGAGSGGPASQAEALRRRVAAFIGEREFCKYYLKWPHFFMPPYADVLDGELRYCVSGVASGEVQVQKNPAAMLWFSFKRALVQRGLRIYPADVGWKRPADVGLTGLANVGLAAPENRAT